MSSCQSSSSSSAGDIDAAYALKFSCYDGTFGKDMKEKDESWVRLRSLNLSEPMSCHGSNYSLNSNAPTYEKSKDLLEPM